MITHNLTLAEEYCRRFIVMHKEDWSWTRMMLHFANYRDYREVFLNLGVTLQTIPGIGGDNMQLF